MDFIEVKGLAVFGFGEQRKILWNLLVVVLHFVEFEERNESLSFGILRDFERHVEIDHACQQPTDMALRVAR